MPAVLDQVKQVAKAGTHSAGKGASGVRAPKGGSTSIVGAGIEGVNNALGMSTMALYMGLPIISTVTGWLSKLPLVGKSFGKASTLANAPNEFINANTVEQAVDRLGDAVGHDKLNGAKNLFSGAEKMVEKGVGALDKYIKGTSSTYGNLKQKTSSAASDFKKLSVADGIQTAAVYSGAAFTGYSNISKTHSGIEALKDMCQDVSGERPSLFRVMFGKVPECVKEARGQFMKTAITRTITDALSIFVSVKYARNFTPKAFMLNIASTMGAGAISSFIIKSNPVSDLYSAIRTMQEDGQPVPAEMMAEFIGNASKSARKAGGADNKSVQVMAQKYINEALSIGEILCRIEGGKFDREVAGLRSTQVQQSRGQVKQPAAPAPSNLSIMPAPSGLPLQPVMGAHTASLNNVRQMPKPFAGRAA